VFELNFNANAEVKIMCVCVFLFVMLTLTMTEPLVVATRRAFFQQAGLITMTTQPLTLPSMSTYKDPLYNVSFDYPTSWVLTTQNLSDRRTLLLFVSPEDPDSNVFLAYTPMRDDFTSLGSFGSVEEVGLRSILPKGELQGSDVVSEMIGIESKKNSYYYDYTIGIPDGPERHLRSVFTMTSSANKKTNAKMLLTFTVQSKSTVYKTSSANSIIDSFSIKVK